MRLLPLVAAATAAFLVVACSSPTPPRGVTVVNNFDAKRYLGTWYEIARFDHRFEREKCGSRVKGKRTLPAHQLALR